MTVKGNQQVFKDQLRHSLVYYWNKKNPDKPYLYLHITLSNKEKVAE